MVGDLDDQQMEGRARTSRMSSTMSSIIFNYHWPPARHQGMGLWGLACLGQEALSEGDSLGCRLYWK